MNYGFRHIFRIHKMRKDLKEVYTNQMIDKFAISLVMVFIPVYLLTIGYSLAESLLVLAVSEIITIVFSIPLASFASRVGLKHAILYRIPVSIALILWLESMAFIELSVSSLLIAGAIWGFSKTLYWIPLNAEFVDNSDKRHRGEEVGFLIALPIIVSVGSPMIGGVVLEFLGSYILFSIFIMLMVLSVVPFFLTQDYRKHFSFEMRKMKFRIGNRLNIGLLVQGLFIIGDHMLWPLYTYMVFSNIIFTGMVASISCLGTAFITLLIGKVCDRMDRQKMLYFGVAGLFATWMLRYLAVTGMEFIILSFIGGIFVVLVNIPIFAAFSDISKLKRRIVNNVTVREMSLSTGRAAIISIIIIGLIDLRTSLAVMAVLCLVMAVVNVSEHPVHHSKNSSSHKNRLSHHKN